MTFDRRALLGAGLVSAGLGASAAMTATAALAGVRRGVTKHKVLVVGDESLRADTEDDQTAVLQAAIDDANVRGVPLVLPAGRVRTGSLLLRPGTRIAGAGRKTILEFLGGTPFFTAELADDIQLENFVIDGRDRMLQGAGGLLHFKTCLRLDLRQLAVTRSAASGIVLEGCSGRVSDCQITHVTTAGLHSLDSKGLEILHNTVTDCANNGIQVWRSAAGEDGTIVSGNRIERISAKAGGTGENGNGVNVFRAGSVLVTGNRITDCAYSAIRGNAASNIQMVANNCSRIGEVALYAEFGFEGALITSNVVDQAASGIAVTNFNEGGRLAVVQGNLVRTLNRREQEPEDKRGIGISVEADSLVTGNTIEGAETAGIVVGWGKWMRDCAITQNLVRNAPLGILVSDDEDSGAVLISGNMISGTKDGAIRMMKEGEAVGPDLAFEADRKGRITIAGNAATATESGSPSGWRGWFNSG